MSDDVFGLIGHPVGHSVSPPIHAAAYRALGRRASYLTLDCPSEKEVSFEIGRLRRGELRGLNVTVPHKQLAARLADVRTESVERIGAANVLSRTERGEVLASNTDAPALAEELSTLIDDRPKSCALVIGYGGAALAAVESARLAGFTTIKVTGRRFEVSNSRANWPNSIQLESLGAELQAFPKRAEAFEELLQGVTVVIQATSVGMKGGPSGEDLARAIPFSRLSGVAFYDLVYNPVETPFLREARRAGHRARCGLGMLVGQAALALQIWWGQRPQVEPLYEAAEVALGLR